ncbi:hypothetical protein A2856_01200 [Candidatus Uhrbacteria bacterium RIFCSPHIGHO2_01_FULL_63_20]|uniref:Antitoxin n=1 Tax=Candidatus Uhrbacteria bacterium RIFCSPHIGHO2_01_FULL_63_20 TaxID=1802385 RepID=A0A1F7TMU1_9BACT|nr:MAG: hypothetical protein A2856_01200 [Candidatus Uhrbacteria bacterium RIFCSPHIGHO2_01_FULL_63_20]
MTTRFIGVTEFRQNMTKFAKLARTRKQRLVVLQNDEPLFELHSPSKADFETDILKRVNASERQMKAGRLVTAEQMERMLR